MKLKEYKVCSKNSTVCGYPGREFDWSKFCWDGSESFRGGGKALLPWVDKFFIAPNCEYLHVPYSWSERGTVYRVRPNPSMRAGNKYRGHLVTKQTAVLKDDGWYWRLEFESKTLN